MAAYILTLSCPDRIGVVATVSTFLAVQRCNILDSAQYGDANTSRFFLRIHFETPEQGPQRDDLNRLFAGIAAPFDMEWRLHNAASPERLLILVSRYGHCLNDLLYRCSTRAISARIVGIVSNHEDMAAAAGQHSIPYFHLPVSKENRKQQEDALRKLVHELNAETLVLARYMQILSPDFCAELPGRIINIHHSFLPSFKGASPYQQAYKRGVKLIGATAHYVTEQLDEGPIIEQDVSRVDHSSTPEDLAATGRDVESLVLARALKAHCEHRVLLNGSKTVVFR